jgi:hypothetical protein
MIRVHPSGMIRIPDPQCDAKALAGQQIGQGRSPASSSKYGYTHASSSAKPIKAIALATRHGGQMQYRCPRLRSEHEKGSGFFSSNNPIQPP